jgi:aryl-alcohol dehydrogenase-like predicted oxidoreductase
MSDGRLMLDPWIAPRRPEAPAAIAVGTMNFGKRTAAAEAERIVEHAVERGLTFFDTANAYGDGESERILGAALRGVRERCGIATKVGFGRVSGKPEGLGRARVLAAFDESRSRLQTDWIDLYYLHVPDHRTPLDETLGAIAELFDKRGIRAFGISNYASWQVLEIFHACDRLGMPRPSVSQQLYNLLIRQLDIEYFKFTRKHPIHTTAYNALAGGLLSGRHDATAPAPAGSRFDKNKLYQGRYWSQRMFELVEALRAIAGDDGMSLLELSYGWLASRPGIDSVLVGPATVEQLDVAAAAIQKRPSPEACARIDALHVAHLGTETTYAR